MHFDAFTSDPHYNHKKIIEYSNRPFSSVEEMNEEMIKRYNDRVGTNDNVLFLGDIFFGGGFKILPRLKGKKYLVRGNHDSGDAFKLVEMGFEIVSDRLFFMMAGRKIVANHYDAWNYRSIWDDRFEDRRYKISEDSTEILLHGHTHQKSKFLLNQIHVGVDAWDYAPAMRGEIEEIIKHEISENYKSPYFRAQQKDLLEYKRLMNIIRQNFDSPEKTEAIEKLKDETKFGWLRSLGWEKETKQRQM